MCGGGQAEGWDLANLFEGRLHVLAGHVALAARSDHDWRYLEALKGVPVRWHMRGRRENAL